MKAGIMEIGDIFVINKADLEGAEILKINLETTLSYSDCKKPIIMCVATSGKGIDELYNEIENHREFLYQSGEISLRAQRRIKKHVETILNKKISKLLDKYSFEGKNVLELVDFVIGKICNKEV